MFRALMMAAVVGGVMANLPAESARTTAPRGFGQFVSQAVANAPAAVVRGIGQIGADTVRQVAGSFGDGQAAGSTTQRGRFGW